MCERQDDWGVIGVCLLFSLFLDFCLETLIWNDSHLFAYFFDFFFVALSHSSRSTHANRAREDATDHKSYRNQQVKVWGIDGDFNN